ncbi:hypothetical protein ACWDNT_11460 [Streptomyces sp. NPDC000963]
MDLAFESGALRYRQGAFDGTSWSRRTQIFGFGFRIAPALAVHENRLWLIHIGGAGDPHTNCLHGDRWIEPKLDNLGWKLDSPVSLSPPCPFSPPPPPRTRSVLRQQPPDSLQPAVAADGAVPSGKRASRRQAFVQEETVQLAGTSNPCSSLDPYDPNEW